MSAIVIDLGARVVRRSGTDIHLPPKAFDLLLILVRHQPNAVPHEQLHTTLWPGVHVSETSLPALVTLLRKALGDTADEGRVIRTLARVGYAFIGDATFAGHALAGTPICRLVWRRRSFEVSAGESVMGRDRGCAIRIDAESVSRHHARLHASARTVSIEDLGSKNGTWVAGDRIHDPVALADGMCFRLGSETIRVELTVDERPTKTAVP
jgi:DNA-binding winged helix-turn-helix (wHTH) protein